MRRVRTFPAGAVIVRPKGYQNVEIALYTHQVEGRFYGCPAAVAYQGKRRIADIRGIFRSVEDRDAHLADFLTKCRTLTEVRAVRRESRKAQTKAIIAENAVKVGDIFCSSWGWEQTNIDFYQVISAKGSFVTLHQIGQNAVDDGPRTMTGKTTPRPNEFKTDEAPIRRKVNAYSGGLYVKINSYASAKPWTGEPKSYSTYA